METFSTHRCEAETTSGFFTQASDGVRIGQWDLSPARMREIPVLIPPPDEQAAIVRYLDDADQRILDYVSAKERLIALLEEERQAVIHQAVTQGLDPTMRLKPSGVGWLGNVPEQWEVRRLKFFYAENSREVKQRVRRINVSLPQDRGYLPEGKRGQCSWQSPTKDIRSAASETSWSTQCGRVWLH